MPSNSLVDLHCCGVSHSQVHGCNGGNSGDVVKYLQYLVGKSEAEQIEVLGSVPMRRVMLLNCGLHDIKCNNSKHRKAGQKSGSVDLDGASEKDATAAVGEPHVTLPDYADNLRKAMTIATEQLHVQSVVWVRTTGVVDAIHNTKGLPWNRFASFCVRSSGSVCFAGGMDHHIIWTCFTMAH